MLDLAVAVVDPPATSGQYRYVETHAWWLGTFGLHQYLSEQRLRQWVPVHPERDWLLERELTGAHTWLTGSAVAARADGFDLREMVPTGRFRARLRRVRHRPRDEPDSGRSRPARRPHGARHAVTGSHRPWSSSGASRATRGGCWTG